MMLFSACYTNSFLLCCVWVKNVFSVNLQGNKNCEEKIKIARDPLKSPWIPNHFYFSFELFGEGWALSYYTISCSSNDFCMGVPSKYFFLHITSSFLIDTYKIVVEPLEEENCDTYEMPNKP